jgi:hypothetical protein
MNVSARIIIFVNLLFVMNSFSAVRAEEALVKIANISGLVMDRYSFKKGRSFFAPRDDYYDALLEQALDSGVRDEAVSLEDIRYMHRESVLEKDFGEAAEIKELFSYNGVIKGRQLPAGGSGWNKFIVAFKSDDSEEDFIVKIAGGDVFRSEQIYHVAVKNEEGRLKNRAIRDMGFGNEGPGTVCRISRTYFKQQIRNTDASEWFRKAVPTSNGVGVMIVREDYEYGMVDNSDTVLVRIRTEGLPDKKDGMPEAAIVIGWKRQ